MNYVIGPALPRFTPLYGENSVPVVYASLDIGNVMLDLGDHAGAMKQYLSAESLFRRRGCKALEAERG